MQTYIYFHICRMNNWKEIVEKLWTDIRASGLYDKVTEIRAVAVGETKETPPVFFSDPKFRLLHETDDKSNFERSTLNLLYLHSADAIDDFHVLYIHSKGVQHNNRNAAVTDWTKYLSYFNIYKHEQCIRELAHNDAVGVNLSNAPQVHFSGNFWWSKPSHIKRLADYIPDYYTAPEDWVTMLYWGHLHFPIHREFYSVFNSGLEGLGHYYNPYPETNYREVSNNNNNNNSSEI